MDAAALIGQLREEGAEVKGCFTDFSFKALTISATALALMFATLDRVEMVDFAAIPVIGLLYAVARIGIYKYSASNRTFGYQLHLARTENADYGKGAWQKHMREIDWEEALRAWRVVQPALFRAIYQTAELTPGGWFGRLLRSNFATKWLNERNPFHYRQSRRTREVVRQFVPGSGDKRYPWFHLPTLTRQPENVTSLYHAGSYLKNMTRILFLMQALLLLPMGIQIWKSANFELGSDANGSLAIPRLVTFGLLVGFILLRYVRIARWRWIIEDGILCIHSTAITWQAVVLAHYRAVADNVKKGRPPLDHYTEALMVHARSLADNAFSIHDWITDPKFAEPTPAAVR